MLSTHAAALASRGRGWWVRPVSLSRSQRPRGYRTCVSVVAGLISRSTVDPL